MSKSPIISGYAQWEFFCQNDVEALASWPPPSYVTELALSI